MKKILSILLFLTSCATVDTSFKEITVLKSLQQGMTIKDFITLNGPPFSIEDNEDGAVFIFYERSFWASRADFVGIYMDVKKNVLRFDNQGIFLEKLDSNQRRGYFTIVGMSKNSGWNDDGGKRAEKEFTIVGSFLAEKRIFFNQESWKKQNVANNYYYETKEKI
jgi:hypothetical protein